MNRLKLLVYLLALQCFPITSSLYAAALTVYSYAKASGQGAGLEAVVDKLGQRFACKSRREKPQKAEA